MTSFKAFFITLGLLFLASSAFAYNDEHVCNHDNEDYVAEDLDVEEDMSVLDTSRRLQQEQVQVVAPQYSNMRILASFDPLDDAPASFKAYVEFELAPPVLSYLSAALRVKYPVVGQLRVTSKKVCDVKTPPELKTGVDADYFMIFDSRDEDSSTVASSRACQTASGTKRPLIGYTNFNRNMLQEAKGDVLLHEKNMYLLIHEIMHTLGISKNAYDSYIDEFGKTRKGHIKKKSIGGKTHSIIDVPPLTERLRKHYGCPTLEGAIMENDGGSGTALSHFERKFFVYETMSSGGIFGRRVSEFSLAMLEGSGWYVPDYNYAEPYFYGQGQGCSFINEKCSSSKSLFDEFCTGSSRGCAPTGRGGGKCSSDSKANGCKYVEPDTEYDCDNSDAEDNARLRDHETYGRSANAKCFTGNLDTRRASGSKTSFCFKYTCVGTGSATQLEVQLGNQKVMCTEKGQQTVDGLYGTIDCPDPLAFCNTVGKQYCPRGCMGRGTCMNNQCVCNSGFTGIDCGLFA